jgi:hypothetical protein
VQEKRGTPRSLRGCGRGSGTVGRIIVVSLNGFVQDPKRLIEKVCCTTQGNLNLLESLFPSPFLLEALKTVMMLLHDRLLRIQHETIDGCHEKPPFV